MGHFKVIIEERGQNAEKMERIKEGWRGGGVEVTEIMGGK